MPIQVLQDEKDVTCWFILYLRTSYWVLGKRGDIAKAGGF